MFLIFIDFFGFFFYFCKKKIDFRIFLVDFSDSISNLSHKSAMNEQMFPRQKNHQKSLSCLPESGFNRVDNHKSMSPLSTDPEYLVLPDKRRRPYFWAKNGRLLIRRCPDEKFHWIIYRRSFWGQPYSMSVEKILRRPPQSARLCGAFESEQSQPQPGQ